MPAAEEERPNRKFFLSHQTPGVGVETLLSCHQTDRRDTGPLERLGSGIVSSMISRSRHHWSGRALTALARRARRDSYRTHHDDS